MFNSFAEFFTAVKEARFGFGEIWDYIVSLYYEMTVNPDISSIWNGFMSVIEPIYKTVMTLAVVGCIIIAFFGKKLKGFLSFVFFFVIGFALGTHLLAPIIPEAVKIPGWLVGLVVALVSGVLYRFLYYILYVLTVGYGSYLLIFNGFYLSKEVTYTTGKAIVCLVVAAVVVAAALIFRKYIEMVGTAFLGGWLAAWVFANYIYAYTLLPVFAKVQWLGLLIPAVIIAAFGSVVQIKTRRRY